LLQKSSHAWSEMWNSLVEKLRHWFVSR
jgi:hypothetical protein